MDPKFDAFVGYHGEKGVPFELDREKDAKTEVLWGDGVYFLDEPDKQRAGFRFVRVRGQMGWIGDQYLDGKALLELYFIDVGQGDGVLIRTPDFRHVLIDAGFPRKHQPTKKSGADFVDWKFHREYDRDADGKTIYLDAMIASHNDYDHYGGLDDLLDVAQEKDLDCEEIRIEAFFHAGLSWWKSEQKDRFLGGEGNDSDGNSCFVDLIDDSESALAALDTSQPQHLQGAWAAFIRKVLECKNAEGGAMHVQRLSHLTGTLPQFETGDGVVIELLGPIERDCGGTPGLRVFPGGPDKSTNGHSIVLRLTYGKTRFLITGDLNTASQADLLAQHDSVHFACDVAKACHHGSDDVSLSFLEAMNAAVTVISSGDAEGHDHPRPRIVAASGITGHKTVEGDQLRTPLVYCTEMARSYKLGAVEQVSNEDQEWRGTKLKGLKVDYKEHKPGSLQPERGACDMHDAFVLAGLVYGLVNVRTDGTRIMCATRNEGKQAWSVREFQSRF
jgi:hypothetical protein